MGLRVKAVSADGNCFFRALSDQLHVRRRRKGAAVLGGGGAKWGVPLAVLCCSIGGREWQVRC